MGVENQLTLLDPLSKNDPNITYIRFNFPANDYNFNVSSVGVGID